MSLEELRNRMRNSRAAFALANGRLPQPVDLVRVQRFGSNGFRCAVAEMQGWRATHEDAHAVSLHYDNGSAVFLVLDGHSGDEASQFCAPALSKALGEEVQGLAPGVLPEDACLEKIFLDVDAQFRDSHKGEGIVFAGTTVVGAVVARHPSGTYVVKLLNCGDSRGIVINGGLQYGPFAAGEPMTEKKGNVGEKARVDGTDGVIAGAGVTTGCSSVANVAHTAKATEDGDEGTAIGSLDLTMPRRPAPSVRLPAHLTMLAANDDAALLCLPVIVETVDHKPNHPTERARITAAGGVVSEEGVARVNGLAVSRSLGDFMHKRDETRNPTEQLVSCLPDVYEVKDIRAGSLLVLACDGLWDILTSKACADIVGEKVLEQVPPADLGDICADLVRRCVDSRDNVTCLIVRFVDGADWQQEQDEMKSFEKVGIDLEGCTARQVEEFGFVAEVGEIGDAMRKKYHDFLERSSFSSRPRPCSVCGSWRQHAETCTCETAVYCSKACKEQHWPLHRRNCPAVLVERRARCEEMIVKQFKLFDINGDGRIDKFEMASVLRKLDPVTWTEQNVDRLLETSGTGDDGLQYEDFVKWVCGADCEDPILGAFYSVLRVPSWKVVRPAQLLGGLQEDNTGKPPYLLAFLDIDGVLNTDAEDDVFVVANRASSARGVSSRSGTPRGGRTPRMSDSHLASEKAVAEQPLVDPMGKCAVGLNRKCMYRLQQILASFVEPLRETSYGAPALSCSGGVTSSAGAAETDSTLKVDVTRVRLVVSSTWRLSDNQMAFFRWALPEVGVDIAFVVGCTASLLSASRGVEVRHFLAECAWLGSDVSAWVAIDDSEENLEGLAISHRVLVNSRTGLDTVAAVRARKALAMQDIAWHSSRGLPSPRYAPSWDLIESNRAVSRTLSGSSRATMSAPRRPSPTIATASTARKSSSQSPAPKRASSSRTLPAPPTRKAPTPPRQRS